MFTVRLALGTILVFLAPNLFASDTAVPQILRFAVVINGRTGGSEVDSFAANGQLDSTFEFNDRGRGPKVTSHYVISANGLLSRVDITGNDHLKAPVDEHFAVEEGVSHWKSTSENGQTAGPGFYISNNGPPTEAALLVAALLKAKGSVRLFPSGEARLARRDSFP